MYYRIKNQKLYDYAEYEYSGDCLETDIITQNQLDKDKRQVIVEEYEEEIPPVEEGDEPIVVTKYRLALNPNYDPIALARAKAAKYTEALKKAYDFEQNGTVEFKNCVFEMSLSNRNNLDNTQEALEKSGQTQTEWLDKNDELVTLTLDDIQYIRLNLILDAIQSLWIVKYPAYKVAINEAETIEAVEAIEIDYQMNAEVESEVDENNQPEAID